ncbi:MAG: nucleotide exchange factor GrpE [Gammaproteobacteria bacterium]|nr:MAG: nucleotide exchange factor GrpE [Gammaproteobacteria bacterium]
MTNTEQNVETDDSIVNETTHEQEDAQPQADASEPNTNEPVQELDQQLEDAQQQAAEYHDKMLRMQAEMENLRKRTERDVSNAHKYAVEKFANELLQVKDSLELGLSTEDINIEKLQEGTELTLKMLCNSFEKFSLEEVNPVGEAFDPNLHEAMTMQESADHKPNTVLTVVQKGYTLHGRLIRPAMVIVAKAAE